MLVGAGEGTMLSLMLLRNGAPLSGKTASVRVVSMSGIEFTASTAAPETSEPGLYSVPWTAPGAFGRYLALWSVGFRTWSEEIEVMVVGAVSPTSGGEMVGVVAADGLLIGIIESDDETVGVIPGDPLLVGVVEQNDPGLIGVVESDDDVIGVFTEA